MTTNNEPPSSMLALHLLCSKHQRASIDYSRSHPIPYATTTKEEALSRSTTQPSKSFNRPATRSHPFHPTTKSYEHKPSTLDKKSEFQGPNPFVFKEKNNCTNVKSRRRGA
ncbi:hypothetical protein N665_0591s0009 [Sinapis alba]|nr:hypothetical protein N665_0591s0009 [Sinapis alba]